MATLPNLLAGVDFLTVDASINQRIKDIDDMLAKKPAKDYKKQLQEEKAKLSEFLFYSEKKKSKKEVLNSANPLVKESQEIQQERDALVAELKHGKITADEFSKQAPKLAQREQAFITKFRDRLQEIFPGEENKSLIDEQVKKLEDTIESRKYETRSPGLLSGVDNLRAIDESINAEIKKINGTLNQVEELEQRKTILQSKLLLITEGIYNSDNELIRVANRFQQEYDRLFAGISSGNLRAHEASQMAERLKEQQQDFVKLYRDYLETLPKETHEGLIKSHKESLEKSKEKAIEKIETEAKMRLGVEKLETEGQTDAKLIEDINKIKQERKDTEEKFDKQIEAATYQAFVDADVNKLKESLKKQTENIQTIANRQAHISFIAHYVDKYGDTKLHRETFKNYSDADFTAKVVKRTENNSETTVIKFTDLDAKKYNFTANLSTEAELVISVKEQANGQINFSFNLQGPDGTPRYFYSEENYQYGLRAAVKKIATYPNLAGNLGTIAPKYHDMVVKEWIKAGRTLNHLNYPGVPHGISDIIVQLTEQNASVSYQDLKAYLALSNEDKNTLATRAAKAPDIKKLLDIHKVLIKINDSRLHEGLNDLSQANFNKIQGHAKDYFTHLGRLEKSGKTFQVTEEKPVDHITLNHEAFKQHVYSFEKLVRQGRSSDPSRFIDDKYSLETKVRIFTESGLQIWKQKEIIKAIKLGPEGQNRELLEELINVMPKTEQGPLREQKFGKKNTTGENFNAVLANISPKAAASCEFLQLLNGKTDDSKIKARYIEYLDTQITNCNQKLTGLDSEESATEEPNTLEVQEMLTEDEKQALNDLAQFTALKSMYKPDSPETASDENIITTAINEERKIHTQKVINNIQEIIDNKKLSNTEKGRLLEQLLDIRNEDIKKHVAKCLFGATDKGKEEQAARIFTNLSEEKRAQLLQELNDNNLLTSNSASGQDQAPTKAEQARVQTINSDETTSSDRGNIDAVAKIIANTYDPLVLHQFAAYFAQQDRFEDVSKKLLTNTEPKSANVKRLREMLKSVLVYDPQEKKFTTESVDKQYPLFLTATNYLNSNREKLLEPAEIATLYCALTQDNKKEYLSHIADFLVNGDNEAQEFKILMACSSKMKEDDARHLLETLHNKGLDVQQKLIFDKLKPEIQAKVFSALTPDNQRAVVKSAEAKIAVTYLNTLPSTRDDQKKHLAQVFEAIEAKDADTTKQVKASILAQLNVNAVTAVLTAKNNDRPIIEQKDYDTLGNILLKEGRTSMAKFKMFHEIRKFEDKELVAKLFPKDNKKEVENTGASIGHRG